MKRYLTFIMLAVAAFVAAPQVSAYNETIAELAKMLDEAAANNGFSVEYDGTNLIMNFPQSFLSADEREMFASVEDLQPLAPYVVQSMGEMMSAEDMQLFGIILSETNTNLIVRWHLDNKTRDLIIKGDDFPKK